MKKLYFFCPLILDYAELVVPNIYRTDTKQMHLSFYGNKSRLECVCVCVGSEVSNNIFKINVLLEWDDFFKIDSQLHDALLEVFFDALHGIQPIRGAGWGYKVRILFNTAHPPEQ